MHNFLLSLFGTSFLINLNPSFLFSPDSTVHNPVIDLRIFKTDSYNSQPWQSNSNRKSLTRLHLHGQWSKGRDVRIGRLVDHVELEENRPSGCSQDHHHCDQQRNVVLIVRLVNNGMINNKFMIYDDVMTCRLNESDNHLSDYELSFLFVFVFVRCDNHGGS